MTLRERIADWLTDGLYSRYHWQSLRLQWDKLADAQDRLDRIAAQETPNANATVRRMARIARGDE